MASKKKRPIDMMDAVRRAFRESGMLGYELSEKSGVRHSVLSRFMSGSHIQSSAFEKLAAALGYQLTKTKGK
ncbi:MAG: XRE family transcriptional regulator [Planctomycetaceae bacterium]|nr:XRE family transcriptional regulator [Planctomycetaceae bacterium]